MYNFIIFILFILIIIQLNIINIALISTKFSLNYYDNCKLTRFKIDHSKMDGYLVSYKINKYLQEKRVSCYINKNIDIPKYLHLNYNISNNEKKYSEFTNVVSHYIYSYLKRNKINKLNIGILVSKRHLLKHPKQNGNFIKIVCYKVTNNMNINNICKLHNQMIKKEKNNKNTYMNLFNNFNIFNVDLFINSWSSLSEINYNKQNTYLLNNFLSLKEFYKNEPIKKKYICISKYKNIWFINNITPINSEITLHKLLKY